MLGSHSGALVNVEAVPHHSQAETIAISEAHLLFAAISRNQVPT